MAQEHIAAVTLDPILSCKLFAAAADNCVWVALPPDPRRPTKKRCPVELPLQLSYFCIEEAKHRAQFLRACRLFVNGKAQSTGVGFLSRIDVALR